MSGAERERAAAGAPGADGAPSYDFAAELAARACDPALRKTERTRARLMASLAGELASGIRPADLKVAGVTANAGLAHGTFYRYFTDMQAATEALIAAFSEFVRERLAAAREGETGSRARVRGATLVYTLLFRDNPALMRCMIEVGAESTTFSRTFQELNRDWNLRMAAAIARGRAGASGGRPRPAIELLPVAYALGGMVDEFLTQLYLRRDPALAHLAGDEEAVADLLTELWRLGAYGKAP